MRLQHDTDSECLIHSFEQLKLPQAADVVCIIARADWLDGVGVICITDGGVSGSATATYEENCMLSLLSLVSLLVWLMFDCNLWLLGVGVTCMAQKISETLICIRRSAKCSKFSDFNGSHC